MRSFLKYLKAAVVEAVEVEVEMTMMEVMMEDMMEVMMGDMMEGMMETMDMAEMMEVDAVEMEEMGEVEEIVGVEEIDFYIFFS
jgi:hypothetical protein